MPVAGPAALYGSQLAIPHSLGPELRWNRRKTMRGNVDHHFVTVAEVSAIMRVSKATVYRMILSGDLPAARFGRSYRLPQSVITNLTPGSPKERVGTENIHDPRSSP